MSRPPLARLLAACLVIGLARAAVARDLYDAADPAVPYFIEEPINVTTRNRFDETRFRPKCFQTIF
jgi:hypothetical protein